MQAIGELDKLELDISKAKIFVKKFEHSSWNGDDVMREIEMFVQGQ